MMWLILPLISSIFHALGTTFDKKAIKFNKPDNFLLFSLAITALIMLPLSPIFFMVTDWWSFLLRVIPIVLIDGTANIFFIRALKQEEAGYCLPLVSISPFFTVIFSFVLAPGELLPVKSMIAIFAIIFSIYVLNMKDRLLGSLSLLTRKSSVLLTMAAMLYGLAVIITKYALAYTNPPTLYFVRIGLMVPFIFTFLKGKLERPKAVGTMTLAAGFYILTFVTYYLAISQYNLLISVTLSYLGPIFLLFSAYIFLKEKITWQKMLASIVIVGGIFLLG